MKDKLKHIYKYSNFQTIRNNLKSEKIIFLIIVKLKEYLKILAYLHISTLFLFLEMYYY